LEAVGQKGKLEMCFKIGVVTDEISQDLVEAVEVAQSWGLEYIELHSVWGQNICDIDSAILSRVISIVRHSGLTVTGIDSLTLRCNLDDDDEYVDHISHLRRSIEVARLFDTNMVRLFSFWKLNPITEETWKRIFEKMELPIRIAESEGITLGFENVSSGNIGTSQDLEKLFSHFESPNLKLIWDPGNAYAAGDRSPNPEGYHRVKNRVVHVHVKDIDFDNGKQVWRPVGAGIVDYQAELQALKDDGYDGVVALETHFRLPGDHGVKSTRQSYDGLMAIVNQLN